MIFSASMGPEGRSVILKESNEMIVDIGAKFLIEDCLGDETGEADGEK